MIKIDYWSDLRCPYCYINQKQLKDMINSLDESLQKEITCQMHSFELDPYAPKEVDYTTMDVYAKNHGMSDSEARLTVMQISTLGRRNGLNGMDYGGTIPTNTFDAHRLNKYAIEKGNFELEHELMDAYFCKHENLSNHDVLETIAVNNGLNKEEVRKVLESNEYAQEVKNDEKEAFDKKIMGVPFFIVDGKTSYQSPNSIKQYILDNKKGDDEITVGNTCRIDNKDGKC